MKPRLTSLPAIAATLLALLTLCATLLPHVRPSSEAVRLRNALLFDRAGPADFAWTPAQRPASFPTDSAPLPAMLATETAALLATPGQSDWDKSLRIASHLIVHARNGGAAQSDLAGTYQTILAGGGYCADFTTVFIAMARQAGVFAREWAFSFDGYGGHGHALVEVWDNNSQRWRMLDVFHNFYAVDHVTRQPLSALAFRAHIAGDGSAVDIVRIGAGRDGFRSNAALYQYYRGGVDQWYLWWGNAVYRYDASPATRLLGHLSRSGEQLLAIALGDHPRIRALPTSTNGPLREAAFRLQWRLTATLVAGVLLAVLLAWQLLARRHNRGPAHA